MSATSCIGPSYAKRSNGASIITMFGFAPFAAIRHKCRVLGHDELIEALRRARDDGRVKNADVQELLRLPSSRVSEIFEGRRRVTLDEAKRLVETFDLDEEDSASRPARLHGQAAKLFVYHVAKALGADTNQGQAEALAVDLQGFVEFATAPELRDELDRVQQFFLGRLPPQPAVSPESGQ